MLIYTIGLGTIFSVSKPGIMPEKIFGMQEDAFQAFSAQVLDNKEELV